MTHNAKKAQKGQISGLQWAKRQKVCQESQPIPLLQEALQSFTLPSPPSLLPKSPAVLLLGQFASLRAQCQQVPRGTFAPSAPDLPLRSGPHCNGSLKSFSRTGWSGRGQGLALLWAARRGRLCSMSAADSDLAVPGERLQTPPGAALTVTSCRWAASSQWGH